MPHGHFGGKRPTNEREVESDDGAKGFSHSMPHGGVLAQRFHRPPCPAVPMGKTMAARELTGVHRGRLAGDGGLAGGQQTPRP